MSSCGAATERYSPLARQSVFRQYGLNRLAARLPILGPVVGWTRASSRARGALCARVWMQLDDTRDELPRGGLYAIWDPSTDRVLHGSVRFVRAMRLHINDPVRPPVRMYFAVTDIELPRGMPPGCVVRAVSLQLIRDPSNAGRTPFEWLDVGPDTPAFSGHMVRQGGDEDWLATALKPVKFGELYPEQLRISDEELAAAVFRQLEADLEEERRVHDAPKPKTYSRRRLRARSMSECEVRLAPSVWAQLASPPSVLTFAAGCCRHPGTGFERARASRTLEALAAAARDEHGPAFALFVGDQIYADATAGVFDVANKFEKYSNSYHTAFDADAFRHCASTLPLYMAADDHEIDNDWSNSKLSDPTCSQSEQLQRRDLLRWASVAFTAYQRLHGPSAWCAPQNPYTFDALPLRFFVMDTRFQRWAPAPHVSYPQICDPAQLKALLDWLYAQRSNTEPKFIVSGSVFAPGIRAYRDDPATAPRAESWQAFPVERAAVLRHMVEHAIDNVVFVSGDYHCSAVAALTLFDKAGTRIDDLHSYAIVVPPLYAPYPFANARAVELCRYEAICDPGPGRRLLATCKARPVDGNGFAQITVTTKPKPSLEVTFFAPESGTSGAVISRPFFRAQLAAGKTVPLRLP
jgi:hypothetical protein